MSSYMRFQAARRALSVNTNTAARRALSVNTNTAALGVHRNALPSPRQTPVTPGTQDPDNPYVESWTPPGEEQGLRPVPLFSGTPRTPGTDESPVSVVSPASLVGLPGSGLRVWPVWDRVFPEGALGVDGEILDFLPKRTGWFQCPLTRLWGPATTVVCDPPFSCILCFNEFQEQARCACGPHGNGVGEDRMCCACVGHLLRQ